MIQAFKSCSFLVLNGVDDSFQKECCYILIPGLCMQFNMLRACTMKPEHSAHSFLFVTHEFNKFSLVPLGYKVIIHNSKFIRLSWSGRDIKGFYIFPSRYHYLCYICLNPSTNCKRVTNTVEIFAKCGMPKTSSLDRITMLLDKLRDDVSN